MGSDPHYGWDGEQSCLPSDIWFYNASQPLSMSSGDVNGENTTWTQSDLLDKTVRCDVFSRNYRADSGYETNTYDITFLDPSNPVIDPSIAELPDTTAHVYTSGWRIGAVGQLRGVLISFNDWELLTEQGYIFVHDTREDSRNNRRYATHFSHCYLRDESEPLRASGYCVDYDGDGIGWNGRENCQVQAIDPNCDYSQATVGSNNGFGYNTVTGQSCPPIAGTGYTPADECRGWRSDGWGWNAFRQESCRVTD